ncbi:MAG: hypothetical protein KDB82_05615 [Planctomycetes bacterium]|nr:hypothetical protein [Planctomycetota bacterium]
MRFNALVVAVSLLAIGGLAALRPVRESLGLALDDSLQLAVIHAELALAPLLFVPVRGARSAVLSNLTAAAACWAAGGAVVLLFSFASMGSQGLDTRGLSAAVWLASAGLLSLAARGGPQWTGRARVALLALFGLPPLWHYLALEYSGASALRLKVFSPNWALATDDISLWALIVLGVVAWVAAAAPPGREKA